MHFSMTLKCAWSVGYLLQHPIEFPKSHGSDEGCSVLCSVRLLCSRCNLGSRVNLSLSSEWGWM